MTLQEWMPKYSKTNLEEAITKEETLALVNHANNYRDKCLVSIASLIPVRPSELKQLKRKNFLFFVDPKTKKPSKIEMEIITKKLRGKYFPKRNFEINMNDIPLPMFKAIWIYVKSMKTKEQYIFNISDRRIRQIIDTLGMVALGRNLCIYALRHWGLTQSAKSGKGIEALMYLKGSADVKSVSPYLHGKKQVIEY